MQTTLDKSDVQLVQRYSDLDLSEKELASFENRILNDAQFKLEAEKYLGTRESILQIIEKNQDKFEFQKLNSSNGLQKKVAYGLFVLVAMLTLIYFSIQQTKKKNTMLFAETESFVYMISSNDMRSVEEDVKNIIQTSFNKDLESLEEAYKKGELSKAESKLKIMRSNYQDIADEEILDWWTCIVMYKKGDIKQAKEYLKKISNSEFYNSKNKAKELIN